MAHALAWLRTGLIVLAAALIGVAARAQDYPPRPTGPVYDGAEILSPATESDLDRKLRDYNRQTGRAIVVATIPSLEGEQIEPYATGLFSHWGIGGEKRDTGLLLLIAREDRKLRIEVGYGLHPWFGGIMSGRVINDVIVPRFKAGDFDGGVTQGVDAILAHLAKSPADAAAIEEAAKAAEAQRQSEGGFPVGAIFWFAFILFFFILPMLRGRGRRRRYNSPWGSAARDIILWEVGKGIARGMSNHGRGGFGGGFGGGGFGGFGGGMSGGGGASGSW